jgi:thioredoxin reductase
VQAAAPADGGFEVTADGATIAARRLLLATGVTDQLPPIDGLAGLWGRGVYHCPYCHGWEARGQQVAVLGGDDQAAHLALRLARLGCDIIVFSNGPTEASDAARAALTAHQIRVCEDPVGRVDGEPGRYARLHLAPGQTLERHALFTHPVARQRSGLADKLGCALLEDGAVQVNELGQTTVPGVYAAGDTCRTPAMPFPAAQVIMAAAQGARAVAVIDQELLFTDAYTTSEHTGPPAADTPPREAGWRTGGRRGHDQPRHRALPPVQRGRPQRQLGHLHRNIHARCGHAIRGCAHRPMRRPRRDRGLLRGEPAGQHHDGGVGGIDRQHRRGPLHLGRWPWRRHLARPVARRPGR